MPARKTWIECRGLPAILWSESNFESICKNIGRIIHYSPITDEDQFYQVPTLLIETKEMNNINSGIPINFEGIEMEVQLVEITNNLKTNWCKEAEAFNSPYGCFQDHENSDSRGEMGREQQKEDSGDSEIDEVEGNFSKPGNVDMIKKIRCNEGNECDDQALGQYVSSGEIEMVVEGDIESSDSLVNPLTLRDVTSLQNEVNLQAEEWNWSMRGNA